MLEMASKFEKRIEYVENDVHIRQMAQIFEKRLNYVGNELDLWEMPQIRMELI